MSTGPLYVCTCCDQLWYKHSVVPASQLTFSNPEIAKQVQNIVLIMLNGFVEPVAAT